MLHVQMATKINLTSCTLKSINAGRSAWDSAPSSRSNCRSAGGSAPTVRSKWRQVAVWVQPPVDGSHRSIPNSPQKRSIRVSHAHDNAADRGALVLAVVFDLSPQTVRLSETRNPSLTFHRLIPLPGPPDLPFGDRKYLSTEDPESDRVNYDRTHGLGSGSNGYTAAAAQLAR